MTNTKREYSNYQKKIFEDISVGKGHTVVIAVAGSGKTTTLIEGFKFVPKKLKTLMIAFNKSIADELRERAPSYVETFTVHSLGFRAIKNSFGNDTKLDPDKTTNLITLFLQDRGYKKQEKKIFETILSLQKMISLCKGYLIDVPSKMDELLDKFDIDTGVLERDEFLKYTFQILELCKKTKNVIDFDDMVFFPAIFNLPIATRDRVFIDELQDLNPAQIKIALSACKKDGRILGVGDPYQAIYGWRGADTNAIDNVVKKLGAKVLPLSVSYRCAKNIVKAAQKIVPSIEYHKDAIDGKVKDIPESIFLSFVKPGDFILSRINAPLIYLCMELLKNKVPANILGKDVGAGLAWMIKKSETKNIKDFLDWLDKWKVSECKRLQDKGRDPILILDKYDCLIGLCKGAKSLEEVKNNIKELFNDGEDTDRVILSSIHKSKGSERDRVFILDKTFRRNGNQEEKNIEYVAITRGKKEVFLVK